MRSTFSLSLLAATALAAPIRPTPLPRAVPVEEPKLERRASPSVIGASVEGFTTISGAAAAAFSSSAGLAAVSASSSAASSSETGSSGSSSSSSGSDGSSSSSSSGSDSGSSSGSSNSGSSSNGGNADLTVANFALQLEKLETEFYKAGLAKFNKQSLEKAGLGSDQSDILLQTFQEQANDEQTHVDFLKSAINSLGGQEINSCQFDFQSVLTNPATFISAARSIELVGVSAYLGGANLISDKSVLTDAASIATIESRHQSALNVFSGGTFAAQPFDIPLTPNAVLSTVSGFLKGCSAKDLGLTANQPLSAINAKTGNTLISGNTILAFESPVLNANSDASKLTCQMIVGGKAKALVFPISKCQVPGNLNGPAMVFISNSQEPLDADVVKQNQNQIVAGPAPLFIDQGTESFQQIFSIKGFGISQIASLNMGGLAIANGVVTPEQESGQKIAGFGSSNNKAYDIIAESNPDAVNSNPIHSGMIYSNQKRGYDIGLGAEIVGWSF